MKEDKSTKHEFWEVVIRSNNDLDSILSLYFEYSLGI
jgi:hypothetical protein